MFVRGGKKGPVVPRVVDESPDIGAVLTPPAPYILLVIKRGTRSR